MSDEKVEKNKTDEKISDSFFMKGSIQPKIESESSGRTEFQEKGTNIKFVPQWDIKFTLGSENFMNLMEFLSQLEYDIVFRFRKKEMEMYVLDTAKTHSILIVSKSIEFAEYEIKNLKDDEERVIYIDIEVMEELSINKELPVDFYVDTLVNKTFYVVNGKEQIEKRLNSLNDESSGSISASKNAYATIKKWMSNQQYQRIVIAQGAIKNLIGSLSKKYGKVKEKIKHCNIMLNSNEVQFGLESDMKKSKNFLNGQDLMVYPIKEDSVLVNLECLVKFNKLKITNQCNMYLSSSMPIIIEVKYGSGNNMTIFYTIAPYAKESS